MPVYPFTYDPGTHEDGDPMPADEPVDQAHRDDHYLDTYRDRLDDLSRDDDHHVEPAAVTVADLLDAVDALPVDYDDHAEWDHYDHVWSLADEATRQSARAINYACQSASDLARRLAALSPSERAEYHRRTT